MSEVVTSFANKWSRTGDVVTDMETGDTYSLKEWEMEVSYLYMNDDDLLRLAVEFVK